MKRLLQLAAAALVIAAPAAGAGGRIAVRAEPARLSWSLFRPVAAISGSREDARIAAEMSFPRPLRIEKALDVYRLPPFTIRVAPQPDETMVRRGIHPSTALLQHEQGHYDIVVLAARALARELDGLEASSARELSGRAEELVSEHTRRAERLSEEYDRDTEHSHDARAQSRWDDLLAAAMRAPAVAKIRGLPL